MSLFKILSRQLVIPLCAAFIFLFWIKFLSLQEINIWWDGIKTYSDFDSKNPSTDNPTGSLYSSVFCRGSNNTDRLCHFHNLCFEPVSELFIFFRGSKSIQSGLPQDRFSPALTDFSSVSDHNTQYFNYVELPESSVSRFNISYTQGYGLIFKRFNPNNLMHVFHDDLIPGFTTVLELTGMNSNIKLSSIFFIFCDKNEAGPYADLYEKFLETKPLFIHSLPKDRLHCFRNVNVGLNKDSTWYQYGFKEPQGPLTKTFDKIPSIILNFRDYFNNQFGLTPPREKKGALLLIRKLHRKILNENEVLITIANYTGLETRIASLDGSSALEVIKEIMAAKLIVGMHGSILILLLFMDPYSVVIELFPLGVDPYISTPYRTISEIPGLNIIYRAWENKIKENSVPHPEYPPELGGIHHLSVVEQGKIHTSSLGNFLCCDNPVWLYRIYQDTLVDSNSFGFLLHDLTEESFKGMAFQNEDKKYTFHPSEVINISCNVHHKNQSVINFSWNQPWNLNYFNPTTVEYEVWIQDIETNEVKAFLMKTTGFAFQNKSVTKSLYIWIRCYADGVIGPFSSSPFVCF